VLGEWNGVDPGEVSKGESGEVEEIAHPNGGVVRQAHLLDGQIEFDDFQDVVVFGVRFKDLHVNDSFQVRAKFR
jgi:hypothetical protein